MIRLDEKRVIVTGAGAGIGRAIALRISEEGARVRVSDVDEESVERVADDLAGDSLQQNRRYQSGRGRSAGASGSRRVRPPRRHGQQRWVEVAGTAPETSEEDYNLVTDVCVRGPSSG